MIGFWTKIITAVSRIRIRIAGY